MQKLTLTISDNFYNSLYQVAGKRNISKFIEEKLAPIIEPANLEAAYQAMAADELREKEAQEWCEGLIND
jgi:predicted CopG family antitoxin